MAKTFIGELILRMKDEMGGKAKQVAKDVDGAMRNIENSAKRLNSVPWGGKFQQQLDKLKLGAGDIDQLRRAWDKLYSDMQGKNLSKALQKSEIGNWKMATLGHFAQQQAALRDELKKTEAHARSWRNSMNNIFKSGLVAMGAYTGAYMGGVAMQGGVIASAQWQREQFRQNMANIPQGERNQLNRRSMELGAKYPSMSITDIAELARNARSMMGSTPQGLAVLEDLVKGQVTLQSAQGTDVGAETMRNLLRGIDNLGQNGGPQGIEQTREILAGMIRASQIEGKDFDPGKLFEFARRAKVAGPGFSTEFLATTVPAIVQDMTANGAGTAFGSAFQAFVMGSNSVTNKDNIANQMSLGIRNGDGLVNSKLFSQDPFRWAQEVLRPALVKDGVDLNDDSAVQERIGGLTKNQLASYSMIRMITQADQIERNRRSYANAMGPDAADRAGTEDPFVSYRGFLESLRNLAAAVGEDVMPTIVSGLNALSGGINSLQQSWRDGDPAAKAGIAAGAAVGGYSAFRVVSAIYGLVTAGAALNGAAVSLQAAAVSLGGAGVSGGAAAAAATGKKVGVMGLLSRFAPILSLATLSRSSPEMTEEQRAAMLQRGYAEKRRERYLEDHPFRPNLEGMKLPHNNRDWVGSYAKDRSVLGTGEASSPDISGVGKMGDDMKAALSPEGKPTVDTSGIDAALQKALQLKQAIQDVNRMGLSVPGGAPSINRDMNRTFGDMGVSP